MSIHVAAVNNDEQLQQALSVRVRVFVEEQQVPPELEVDEYDASADACRHFLVRDGETPIGAARYIRYDAQTAKLQRIAVLESYRGKGIGRLVIAAMEEAVRAEGVPFVILDAQTQAEAFYRKLGYETQPGEPFLDAGIWHVRMRKEL